MEAKDLIGKTKLVRCVSEIRGENGQVVDQVMQKVLPVKEVDERYGVVFLYFGEDEIECTTTGMSLDEAFALFRKDGSNKPRKGGERRVAHVPVRTNRRVCTDRRAARQVSS